jgi:hypothetical protein
MEVDALTRRRALVSRLAGMALYKTSNAKEKGARQTNGTDKEKIGIRN